MPIGIFEPRSLVIVGDTLPREQKYKHDGRGEQHQGCKKKASSRVDQGTGLYSFDRAYSY
jgi:hypothetical protein